MSNKQDLVWERAIDLLKRSPTWHEFHRVLLSEGLDKHLGPSGIQRLLGVWHAESAASLCDRELVAELTFWANGGTYQTHLRGFQAIPSDVLVEESRNRGWFVRIMASRRAIVNPPEGRPLTLTLPVAGASDLPR